MTEKKERKVLTNVEKQNRWRAAQGGRQVSFTLDAPSAMATIYLRKQWGFKSNRECIQAALRHLALLTRFGLTRLDLVVDPDED